MVKGCMKKAILKIGGFFRSIFSPFVWRIFYKRRKHTKNNQAINNFNKFIAGNMSDATKIINLYGYRADMWRGFVDCSVPAKFAHTFFSDLEYGRDCDDWARLWTLWGEKHGYEAKEWLVSSNKKGEFFKKAHMVTTLSKYGEHYLMDYKPFGPCNSLDKALHELSKRYKDGYVFAEYKWKREW